jgi:hypothetical protein
MVDSFQEGRVENILNMFHDNQLHTPGQPMRVLPLVCQALIEERAKHGRTKTRLYKLRREHEALWTIRIRRWFQSFRKAQVQDD